jgi:hypothetical protein
MVQGRVFVSSLLLALALFALVAEAKDQLRIGVKYRPEGCDTARQTKKGDSLSM